MNRNVVQDRIRWFLLSCFGFISSLAKYENSEFALIAPSLAFPLEQLRANGRPLAIALLVLLLIIALNSPNPKGKLSTPEPIIYLWIVQSVIFIKTLDGGDIITGSLIFAIFSSVVIMHLRGPAVWIQDERSLRLGFWAITMVGVIFVVANVYQARINVEAITFIHGWFHGTTANPHHAGVLMVAIIPSLICLLFSDKDQRWKQIFWLIIILFLIFCIYKTASRTSFVMVFVASLTFFRYRLGALGGFMLVVATIIAILLSSFDTEMILTGLDINPNDTTMSKVLSENNTRAGVWQGQWNGFIKNIMFGVPLQGERIRFGESSWLGTAQVLGLAGFIPMLLFGWSTIQLILKLENISRLNINNNYYFYSSAVMSGLVAMLVGGFSEAFLLANLNFSLYVTLQYLILGKFITGLNESHSVRQFYAQ